MVVTKIDMLPTELSPTRLEHWVQQRAWEGGVVSKMTGVHMVSAVRDWGLKNLVEDMVKLASLRGNVWAIGAQNAGKSTLINSIGEHVGRGGGKITHLTEAPVPGTTLEWRGFCWGRESCLTHRGFCILIRSPQG